MEPGNGFVSSDIGNTMTRLKESMTLMLHPVWSLVLAGTSVTVQTGKWGGKNKAKSGVSFPESYLINLSKRFRSGVASAYANSKLCSLLWSGSCKASSVGGSSDGQTRALVLYKYLRESSSLCKAIQQLGHRPTGPRAPWWRVQPTVTAHGHTANGCRRP